MIIHSLLDQDLYKFSMGQIVLHQFSNFNVKYKFKCRSKGAILTIKMLDRIEDEIKHFCTLKMTPAELEYLKGIRFLKPSYIEFLSLYRPNIKHVKVNVTLDNELDITIEGPWFSTIYWEVPLLAIINEVYMGEKYKLNTKQTEHFLSGLNDKIKIAEQFGFKFSEFGTRRRFSYDVQHEVNSILCKHKDVCTGTSNVHFAKKFNMVPIGTMAHEFICAGQGCDNVTLANSQKYMLQKWVDEYRGDLGIALSDTLGTDKFLKDFDPYFAKLYDGVRHDSGDPFIWAERIIKHYEQFKIDPRTKTLVFSDGLTFDKAWAIFDTFKDQANVTFGIGTNLTNDFEDINPLQIVIKMVECNGRPVAKLSDNPAKTMCNDDSFIKYLRSVI